MEEQDKGLDIKGILGLVSYFWQEVWSKKWWLPLGGILFAVILGYTAWKQDRFYPAPFTFFLNSSSPAPLGGISSLLGKMPGGGGEGNFSKIKVIAKSQTIVNRTLNSEVIYDGEKDYLGNYILKFYEEELELDTPLSLIRFGDSTVLNSRNYYRLTKKLRGKMIGNEKEKIKGLFELKNDEESGLMTLAGLAKEPELSILIAETHLNAISSYYINNKVSSQQASYNKVAKTTDSLYGVLRSAEYQLAKIADYSKGLILNQDKLKSAQLQRKLEMVYQMYGEALKNKETANFMLDNETPYFNILDMPVEPLWQKRDDIVYSAIKGFLIGLFLILGVVVGRKWLLDELRE